MAHRRRHLFEVVTGKKHRDVGPHARDGGNGIEEELAAGEIQSCHRLVEHEECGVADHRASEHRACTLALREIDECSLPLAVDADVREEPARLGSTIAVERLFEQRRRSGDTGEHDLEGRERGIEARSEIPLDHGDPPPEEADRHAASRPPRIVAAPELGCSRADATRKSVVLPAPFGHSTTHCSPAAMRQSMSRSNATRPSRRRRNTATPSSTTEGAGCVT